MCLCVREQDHKDGIGPLRSLEDLREKMITFKARSDFLLADLQSRAAGVA